MVRRDDAAERQMMMARQKIRRSKSGMYVTDGRRTARRRKVQRRKLFSDAAGAGAPRLIDIERIATWRAEQGDER